MINIENFLLLRSRAIDNLSDETKSDSFGYHIDVNDAWEVSFSNTELLYYLGIHLTHQAKYSEMSYDLRELNQDKLKSQFDFHNQIVKKTASYINNNNNYIVDIKYDLCELFVDWVFLTRNLADVKRVIDFGAGCGRQVIGLLHNFKNFERLYAIDASLNGYTVQNALFSTCDILDHIRFTELLDYEEKGTDISAQLINDLVKKSNLPNVIHFPAWTSYDTIEDETIDLITACHVHNELSRSDFLRLMELACKKIISGGFIYLRSEMGIWGATAYEDKVHYHAIDPVSFLIGNGFELVDCEYLGGFQCALFKKIDKKSFISKLLNKKKEPYEVSKFLAQNQKMPDKPITSLNMVDNFRAASFFCAENYLKTITNRLVRDFSTIHYFVGAYEASYITLILKNSSCLILEDSEDMLTKSLESGFPIIISDHTFSKFEDSIPADLKNSCTKLQYTFPVVIYIPKKFSYNTAGSMDKK